MKIAITDACIFIDLFLLDILDVFFELPFDIHTTHDVLNELNAQQKQCIQVHINTKKLSVYSLTSEDRLHANTLNFPRSLSQTDKTVLYLAFKLEAMVVSSDKPMRNTANKLKIECHGILWIVDQLLKHGYFEKPIAKNVLTQLIKINPTISGSDLVMREIKKRFDEWSK